MGFHVFRTVSLKMVVFWAVAPCVLVEVNVGNLLPDTRHTHTLVKEENVQIL